MIWTASAPGMWSDERGTNLLDTGAPFYDTYETADGKLHRGRRDRAAVLRRSCWSGLGLAPTDAARRSTTGERWPELRALLHRGVRRPRPATSGPRCSTAPTPA